MLNLKINLPMFNMVSKKPKVSPFLVVQFNLKGVSNDLRDWSRYVCMWKLHLILSIEFFFKYSIVLVRLAEISCTLYECSIGWAKQIKIDSFTMHDVLYSRFLFGKWFMFIPKMFSFVWDCLLFLLRSRFFSAYILSVLLQ